MTRTYNDAVTELAAYLSGKLKDNFDPLAYAVDLINRAEPASEGEDLNLEVRSAHTITGNPLPITVDGFYHDDFGV